MIKPITIINDGDQTIVNIIKSFIEDIYTENKEKNQFIELRNSIIMGIYVVGIERDKSIEYKVYVAYDRQQLPQCENAKETEEFFALALRQLESFTMQQTSKYKNNQITFLTVDFSFMNIWVNYLFHSKNIKDNGWEKNNSNSIVKLTYLVNGYIIDDPNNILRRIQNVAKRLSIQNSIPCQSTFVSLDKLILKLKKQMPKRTRKK